MLGRLIFYAAQYAADAGKRLRRFAPARSVRPLSAPQPAPLASEEIWRRATAPIAGALAGFRRTQGFQAAAAAQIDAADYVLKRLVADLAAVMPMPPDGAALRATLARMAQPVAQPIADVGPIAAPAADKAAMAA